MSLIRRLEHLEALYRVVWWDDEAAYHIMQQIEQVQYEIDLLMHMNILESSYHQGANHG